MKQKCSLITRLIIPARSWVFFSWKGEEDYLLVSALGTGKQKAPLVRLFENLL